MLTLFILFAVLFVIDAIVTIVEFARPYSYTEMSFTRFISLVIFLSCTLIFFNKWYATTENGMRREGEKRAKQELREEQIERYKLDYKRRVNSIVSLDPTLDMSKYNVTESGLKPIDNLIIDTSVVERINKLMQEVDIAINAEKAQSKP